MTVVTKTKARGKGRVDVLYQAEIYLYPNGGARGRNTHRGPTRPAKQNEADSETQRKGGRNTPRGPCKE